jgi:uncharacterized membrane protein
MNNAGVVAGWSAFSEAPTLRGWVWSQESGFTVLPPPPGFTAYRAMDISDTGIVAGDGGADSGLAWRFQDNAYTIIQAVDNLPISYLGGINNAGDIAGTAADSSITTPDRAYLAPSGGPPLIVTPDFGGRATDVNNARQVAGYSNSLHAFRWDEAGGVQFLGSLPSFEYSFANAINGLGQVVGEALSASGSRSLPFSFTDGGGMQQIPAPLSQSSSAFGVNNRGHVVGTTKVSGPDLAWLWTGGDSVRDLDELFDSAAANVVTLAAQDINDAGQILALGFDNNAAEFGTLLLTPPPILGDFNGNGIVDAADYVVWRKGDGPIFTQDDYNDWRANFGRMPGSSTGAELSNATVPEPSTLVLLILTALVGPAAVCARISDVR